ncbi:MAG TPA: lysophospholipid acyltransferase family protein [Burkholderiaceae bacterium]|nr:lysophospholipid acyltransferase family protein [Burkholderiaceae bacterium]
MLTRLFIACMWVLHWLPYPVQRRMGDAIGLLLYAVVGSRRRIALRNLALCFPHWSEAERVRTAKAHCRYFARAFFDRAIFWFAPRARLERLIRIEGEEHLDAAWPERTGKPLILLVPHFLGLDAAGVAYTFRHRGVTMYTAQKNKVIDAQLRRGRERFNRSELYSRQEGIRPIIRAMRRGLPYYVLPDMDFGAGDAVFVDFFGVKTATITVVPKLARSTDANVVALIGTLAEDGSGYVARYYPMWADYPGDRDDEAGTRFMNAFIEDRVREHPAQYYWVHKRFKTRPPGEASLY